MTVVGSLKRCAGEVGVGQVRRSEVRVVKGLPERFAPYEVRTGAFCVLEVGVDKDGVSEDGVRQVCLMEVHVDQPDVPDVLWLTSERLGSKSRSLRLRFQATVPSSSHWMCC